ncbi:ASB17 [Branchiostoma lanceolatum]|uniref:ASB17 protein n=1 Tax=Branchiostoma lanceolatum TaxID=7740 RepID=A0A8K0EDF4_BRALA|nr:ASB17 [Branchiostoma lanceolatum]
MWNNLIHSVRNHSSRFQNIVTLIFDMMQSIRQVKAYYTFQEPVPLRRARGTVLEGIQSETLKLQYFSQEYGEVPILFGYLSVRSQDATEDAINRILAMFEEDKAILLTERRDGPVGPRTYLHSKYSDLLKQCCCCCWMFQMDQSHPLVKRVLTFDVLHSDENTISRLIRVINDKTNGYNLGLVSRWYLRQLQKKFKYFVEVAANTCFDDRSGQRLRLVNQLESPWEFSYLHLASFCTHPKLIALLLRHGADPDRGSPRFGRRCPVEYLFLAMCWDVYKGRDDCASRVRRCLRIYCRAMPKIPLQIPSFHDPSDSDSDSEPDLLAVPHARWNSWVPRDRCMDPCELKHLCRCLIRKRLQDNGVLPGGVYQLKLPTLLQKYLDLLHD